MGAWRRPAPTCSCRRHPRLRSFHVIWLNNSSSPNVAQRGPTSVEDVGGQRVRDRRSVASRAGKKVDVRECRLSDWNGSGSCAWGGGPQAAQRPGRYGRTVGCKSQTGSLDRRRARDGMVVEVKGRKRPDGRQGVGGRKIQGSRLFPLIPPLSSESASQSPAVSGS
jgi:hypothetical protein